MTQSLIGTIQIFAVEYLSPYWNILTKMENIFFLLVGERTITNHGIKDYFK